MAVIEIRVEIGTPKEETAKVFAASIADAIRENHEQFAAYKQFGFTGEPIIEIEVNGKALD